jgi:IS5 family transposase
MDKLIPWKQLEKKVARHYPKGHNGRPPYAVLKTYGVRFSF